VAHRFSRISLYHLSQNQLVPMNFLINHLLQTLLRQTPLILLHRLILLALMVLLEMAIPLLIDFRNLIPQQFGE